ncbi:hypothetical protein PR048_023884 [Dryococelus australis]|uniref:Uncharacterized protein n=1 Tax=Dryococelus australis TaxID=614101 RepID=A0ABQ9GVF3_9NEOP|nr:hypothetical protein PR048_023884 [Dryococelus australis]
MVLGQGSSTLFTVKYDGYVVTVLLRGLEETRKVVVIPRDSAGYTKEHVNAGKSLGEQRGQSEERAFSTAGGAAVPERLNCSPPTEAVRSLARLLQISTSGIRVRRCRWSAGFLGVLWFHPPSHSGAGCSALASFHPHRFSRG